MATQARKVDLWIWRNFRLQLPGDWEMLQFSRNASVGQCAFADRYQFRLELSWREVGGPPDFGRMMSDYKAKLEIDGMEKIHRLEQGEWQGLECRTKDGNTSRFGRFFPRESCIVELVFLWPGHRDKNMENRIVGSVEEEPIRSDGLRRWKAFGMDLMVSDRLELKDCVVECGRAELFFSNTAGNVKERFTRLGLVSEWLNKPIDLWLSAHVGSDVKRKSILSETSVAGHSVYRLTGEKTVGGIRNRRRRCEADAWICPDDDRLYCFVGTLPSREERSDGGRGDRRLSCCPNLGLQL